MSKILFRCPRFPDAKIIEAFENIVREVGVAQAKLYYIIIEGGHGHFADFGATNSDALLSSILKHGGSTMFHMSLYAVVTDRHSSNPTNRELLTVKRVPELLDQVSSEWASHNQGLTEEKFAHMLALARRELSEVKINEALQGFGNDLFDKYVQARDGTLARLEQVATDILVRTQKHVAELEKEQSKKSAALDADYRERQDKLKEAFDKKEKEHLDNVEAFRKEKSTFDNRESKHLRRELREKMLQRLNTLSEKFELTAGTRKLRRPIFWLTLALAIFFGGLTAWAFVQGGEVIAELSKKEAGSEWWQWLLLALRQLAYTVAFVGTAWFFVKWNDTWFRQHADAEFMFKQLELDINRASWVVEMVLEWKEQEGRDVPPELLASLTRNLFVQQDSDTQATKTPPEMASVLLGSAATLKVATPGGAELQFDRKGLKDVMNKA